MVFCCLTMSATRTEIVLKTPARPKPYSFGQKVNMLITSQKNTMHSQAQAKTSKRIAKGLLQKIINLHCHVKTCCCLKSDCRHLD